MHVLIVSGQMRVPFPFCKSHVEERHRSPKKCASADNERPETRIQNAASHQMFNAFALRNTWWLFSGGKLCTLVSGQSTVEISVHVSRGKAKLGPIVQRI